MVIVGGHHWGGYSRRAEQSIHNIHKSVNKLCKVAKFLMRAVYIIFTKGLYINVVVTSRGAPFAKL